MKRIIVFLAEGFEECEGLLAVDILRRAGFEVTTVSVMDHQQICSSHQVTVLADAMAADVDFASYDGVVLPGGIPGTPNLAASGVVQQVCKEFAAQGKLVAAICAAPGVLGGLGLLQGKKATVFPGMEDTLKGAVPTAGEVVRDGNIITSRSMGTAIPFALTIVEYFEGHDKAAALASGICYEHFN